MRVKREQAAKTRRRIVKVAGRLFRRRGLEAVSVADIMQKAGLTHGGFYGHFDSKADLAVQACTAALADNAGALIPTDGLTDEGLLANAIERYLSGEHRDDVENGCTLAALASDAARGPRPLRRAFTVGLQAYIDALVEITPGPSISAKRQKAVATMAGLVGAMVLARAVEDATVSDELLRATSAALRSVAR